MYSGFVGTRLDFLLRYLDIKVLFTVGFSADACLITTVIDALWHDYKVILLRDSTLANDFPEEQERLLGTQRMVKMMEAFYCVWSPRRSLLRRATGCKAECSGV